MDHPGVQRRGKDTRMGGESGAEWMRRALRLEPRRRPLQLLTILGLCMSAFCRAGAAADDLCSLQAKAELYRDVNYAARVLIHSSPPEVTVERKEVAPGQQEYPDRVIKWSPGGPIKMGLSLPGIEPSKTGQLLQWILKTRFDELRRQGGPEFALDNGGSGNSKLAIHATDRQTKADASRARKVVDGVRLRSFAESFQFEYLSCKATVFYDASYRIRAGEIRLRSDHWGDAMFEHADTVAQQELMECLFRGLDLVLGVPRRPNLSPSHQPSVRDGNLVLLLYDGRVEPGMGETELRKILGSKIDQALAATCKPAQ